MSNRSYASLLVHLELGRPNTGLLRVATEIAAQFKSRVIGIVACQPMLVGYGDGYVDFGLIEHNRKDIGKQVLEAEAEFRAAWAGQPDGARTPLEWRSAVLSTTLVDELARHARAADLILTTDPSGGRYDESRNVDRAELILKAGRPVLMVPAALDRLRFQHVLVAWQDTRECRRALSDALPLLQWAGLVSVVEIAPQSRLAEAQRGVADVAGWLGTHGVAAEPVAVVADGNTAAQLNSIARAQRAELIVAGAYGHSRLREWALGGVTRDLLLRADCCTFLSH
jgi:nucleotide-binding universal stress UspA family protein